MTVMNVCEVTALKCKAGRYYVVAQSCVEPRRSDMLGLAVRCAREALVSERRNGLRPIPS